MLQHKDSIYIFNYQYSITEGTESKQYLVLYHINGWNTTNMKLCKIKSDGNEQKGKKQFLKILIYL